jgi:hypothetical protein
MDKEGTSIYIKDLISFEEVQGDFIEETGEDMLGSVIGFPQEGYVMIQPKRGAPFMTLGNHITVKESLIGDILSLKDDAKFQRVVEDAERRYNEALEKEMGKGKRKKSGTTGTRKSPPAPKKITGDIDLNF